MNLFAAMRSPRHVVFGRGQRAAIAGYAREIGNRALICTDERLGSSRELSELVDSLAVAGIESLVFDRTLAEVPLDHRAGRSPRQALRARHSDRTGRRLVHRHGQGRGPHAHPWRFGARLFR